MARGQNQSTGRAARSEIGRKTYENNPYASALDNAKRRWEYEGNGEYFWADNAYDNRGNLVGKFKSDGTLDGSVVVPEQSPKDFAKTDKAIKDMADKFLTVRNSQKNKLMTNDDKSKGIFYANLRDASTKVLKSLGYTPPNLDNKEETEAFIAKVNSDGFTYGKEALRNLFFSRVLAVGLSEEQIYNKATKRQSVQEGGANDPEGNVSMVSYEVTGPMKKLYDESVRERKQFNRYREMVRD